MKPALAVVLALLCLIITACGDDSPAPNEVTGLIISVTPEDQAEEVESFEVRDGEDTYEISIDPEVDYGFDLFHIREHEMDALPVLVKLDERGGDLYAVTIEDV